MRTIAMKSKLITFITEQLLNNSKTIETDTELLVSGILDSLAVMNLVTYIEKVIEKEIPPLDITLKNFSSVGAILDYLETHGLSGEK